MPIHPASRDYMETLREDREAVLLADRLGFAEAFIGEHFTDICETIPSCLSFLASLSHDTQRIKLGSGTVNLANSHPVQVAAHVSMIDHLLEGRFLFGIGPGGCAPTGRRWAIWTPTATPCSWRRSTRSSPSGRVMRRTISKAATGRSQRNAPWFAKRDRA